MNSTLWVYMSRWPLRRGHAFVLPSFGSVFAVAILAGLKRGFIHRQKLREVPRCLGVDGLLVDGSSESDFHQSTASWINSIGLDWTGFPDPERCRFTQA